MYYGKRPLLLTALLTILAGTALHFLYQGWPNAVTALVSPISESLWEHVKLIFWPYLLAALWLNRGRPGAMRPWCLSLLTACLLMLAAGYLYHICLGGEALWVDILIYVLAMGFTFWLPTRFSGPFSGILWLLPPIWVLLLGLLIGWFTLWPPTRLSSLTCPPAAGFSSPAENFIIYL